MQGIEPDLWCHSSYYSFFNPMSCKLQILKGLITTFKYIYIYFCTSHVWDGLDLKTSHSWSFDLEICRVLDFF